jgi:hypothetical protein
MTDKLPESEDSTFLDPHVQLEEVVCLHDALGHDHRADLDKKNKAPYNERYFNVAS